MFGIGSTEILVIAVVGLLILGPRKLPQIAKTVAKGMAQFRRVSSDLQNTVEKEVAKEEDNLRKEETKQDLLNKKEEKPVSEETAETPTSETQSAEVDATPTAPSASQPDDASQTAAVDDHHASSDTDDTEVDAVSSPLPPETTADTVAETTPGTADETAETPSAESADSPESTEVSKA